MFDCPVQLQHSADPVRVQDVVENIEVVEELEILEHKADVRNPKIPPGSVIEITDLDIANLDGTGCWRKNSGNQIQQGSFAGTTGPDDRNLLPPGNLKIRDIQSEFSVGVAKF